MGRSILMMISESDSFCPGVVSLSSSSVIACDRSLTACVTLLVTVRGTVIGILKLVIIAAALGIHGERRIGSSGCR